MADYDLPTVMQALRAADAAGNTADATRLAQIAQTMSQGAAEAPAAAPAPTNPEATVLGQLGAGATKGIDWLDRNLGAAVLFFDGLRGDTAAEERHRKMMEGTAEIHNQMRADNPDAVASYKDIHSAHDAALYAANRVGEALPNIAAMGIGGLAGGAARLGLPIAVGALQGGEDAYQNNEGDLGSTAAGAAIGGAAGAIPVPFMKGGGAIGAQTLGEVAGALGGSALRGAAGGALAGGAQGAFGNIPGAIHSGNFTDAIPSVDNIAEGAASGAAMGAAAGALHGVAPKSGKAAEALSPEQASSKSRLAARIQSEADASGVELGKNVKYGAPKGDEAVLESVHNSIGEDIKGLSKVLKEEMDPAQATDLDTLMNRTSLQATLRDARNKVKGSASEADIRQLRDAVGHTQEGVALVDLVHQSNHLTDLFRSGMKGGVSKYTDYGTPFTRGGAETGRGFGAPETARVLETIHYVANPVHGVLGTAAMLGGRAIDATTGHRSNVGRFVRENISKAEPLDFGDRPSLLRERFAANQAAREPVMDPVEHQRLAAREGELYAQKFQDNNPGLGGFLKSLYDQTGLTPKEASAGVHELHRTGALNGDELAAFHSDPSSLMANKVGLHMMDMLDNMARKGQLQRAPDWAPTGAPTPSGYPAPRSASYEAAARGNQDRVTAAQSRVASSSHPPAVKEAINYAIGAIGRTNNRADAMKVRDALVGVLPHADARSYAKQELTPLVGQIRHATRADAVKAREGRPLDAREKIDVAQKAEALVKNPSQETLVDALGPDDAAIFLRMLNRYDYKTTHPDQAMLDTLVEFERWVKDGRPDNY